MVLKGINFKSLLFASLAGGYVMFFVDHWLNGFLGLFGQFPGTDNTWWMITHHLDGIFLALPFAWPVVYNRLPGAGWLKGLTYGFVLWVAISIIAFVAAAGGAVIFQQFKMSGVGVISGIFGHLVYGFFLGVLYVPQE